MVVSKLKVRSEVFAILSGGPLPGTRGLSVALEALAAFDIVRIKRVKNTVSHRLYAITGPALIDKSTASRVTARAAAFSDHLNERCRVMRFFLSTAIVLAHAVTGASAETTDTALYDDPAPADASFVRFVGFHDRSTMFAGKVFSLPAENKAHYIPVSAAQLDGVAPGRYITVVNRPGNAPSVIEEAPRDDATRVHLFVINTSDTAVSLRTEDGATAVIDDIAPGVSGTRAVNPIAIILGVFAKGDTTPLATFDLSLRRGQNLSFLARPAGVELIENRFAPVAE